MSDQKKTATALKNKAVAAINKKFDALAKKAVVKKVARLPKSKRRHNGRPKNGRVMFSRECIDGLPEFGHLSEIARCLGIYHTTMQQWCAHPKKPLLCVQVGKRKMFRRDILIKWLRDTKRIEPKKVEG